MRFIWCLFFICINTCLRGQNIDELNKINSEKIMNKYFSKSQQQNYLLYGIDKYYLIIIKEKNNYHQYFIDGNLGTKTDNPINLSKQVLNKTFQTEISPCNFIYSVSDSIQRFGSFPDLPKYNYLIMQNQNVKLLEFNLPVLFIPYNKKNNILPISQRLHGYLIEQIYLLSVGKLR